MSEFEAEFKNYFNYFTEVEDHFRVARGTGLFMMSTLDWALVESWKNAGVPLEAVLRGIDAAFEKWRARRVRTHSAPAQRYAPRLGIETTRCALLRECPRGTRRCKNGMRRGPPSSARHPAGARIGPPARNWPRGPPRHAYCSTSRCAVSLRHPPQSARGGEAAG